jgi:hypothetical protein
MALLTDCLHWESSSFCDLPAVARLEHGIWGSGDEENSNYTWKTFTPLLKKQGYETIISVDYTKQNAHAFDDSKIMEKLKDAIDKALGKIGSQNVAGQKVDIVAHSMGGLVVRSFCAQNLDFCKDHIRKLITIDTPHLGSELADLLLIYRDQRDKFPSSPVCRTKVNIFIKGNEYFEIDPHPVDRGAVDSLAVGSVPDGLEKDAIPPSSGAWKGLEWPDSPVRVHRIVGDATEYQNKDIRGLWDGLLNPCGFKRTSVFFGEGGDDGIVGVLSQMGDSSSRPFFDEDHASVLESEKVVKEMEELLK